jgi:hypothetical protein
LDRQLLVVLGELGSDEEKNQQQEDHIDQRREVQGLERFSFLDSDGHDRPGSGTWEIIMRFRVILPIGIVSIHFGVRPSGEEFAGDSE